MQNPAQHSFITTSVLSGVSLRPQKSHQQMENQKSQSDPPKIIMPISISSQPRDDDQPNEAGSTSDQSESDFLFRNIDDEMRSLEVLKNNLERIFATGNYHCPKSFWIVFNSSSRACIFFFIIIH